MVGAYLREPIHGKADERCVGENRMVFRRCHMSEGAPEIDDIVACSDHRFRWIVGEDNVISSGRRSSRNGGRRGSNRPWFLGSTRTVDNRATQAFDGIGPLLKTSEDLLPSSTNVRISEGLDTYSDQWFWQ